MAIAQPAHADAKRAEINIVQGAVVSDDLKSKLERAVGSVPEAPSSDLEARRRGNAARDLAIALLETEGYYRSEVTVTVTNNVATLNVTPGPQFQIRKVEARWTRGAVPLVEIDESQEALEANALAEALPEPEPEPEPAPQNDEKAPLVFPEDEPLELQENRITVPPGQYEASGSIPFVYQGKAPDEEAIKAVMDAITDDGNSLQLNTPSRIPEILEGEGRAVVALKERGYAYAVADPRLLEIEDVVAGATPQSPEPTLEELLADDPVTTEDNLDHQMRVHYHLNPGPLVRLKRDATLNPFRDRREVPREEEDDDDAPVDRANETPENRAELLRKRREEQLKQPIRTKTNEAFVEHLIPWAEGDVYDPEQLAEFERRFMDTGAYSTVSITLDPRIPNNEPNGRETRNASEIRDPTQSVDLGVIVALEDRKRDLREANLTWAGDDGASLSFFRSHYNRTGRADTLRYGLVAGNIDSRIGGDWSLPHFRKINRTLRLSSYVVNENTDAYERQALALSADFNQRLGQNSWFSYGLGIDAGRYAEVRYDPVTQTALTMDRNLVLATLRTSALLDFSDDLLNPTKGWRVQGSLQPTAVSGEDTVFFLRGETQVTGYLPFGEGARTVIAGRAKIGSIIGGDELTVPSDRLFYAGGGSSVRGYAYQGINPRLPNNTPRGGMSLFESSLEVRQRIRDAWQAVVFVDAGATAPHETPNLSNMRYAAGVGVRYLLPFGPVRADVAFPLNKREGDSEFQLYISIGQSF